MIIPMAAAKEIGRIVAEEVVTKILTTAVVDLLLHSVPYSEGSPGIVVDEERARSTPCKCIEYHPGKMLCFSRGVVGALSDEQEKDLCPSIEKITSPGIERRLEHWMEAKQTCKAEIAEIPEGERLGVWLPCMSRELAKKGVEL